MRKKLKFYWFNQSSLCAAVEKGNIEIVQLLLAQPSIDTNIKEILQFLNSYVFSVLNFFIFYKVL